MHRCRQLLTALALLLALAAPGGAASAATDSSTWMHRPWLTEDGLPDITITGVAQTSDGYLWVATKGGLVCFNGQQFFTLPTGNFPLMPSRAVRAMFRDHRDWLWLGMERSPVLCLKPDGLRRFTVEDGLLEQRVVMMAEDREGAVWIVYPSQLRRVMNGRAEPVELSAEWGSRNDILATSDGQGNFWCAKGNHLGVWRDGEWQSQVNFRSATTALCPGSKSNLWVAAGSRLFMVQEGNAPVEVGVLPRNVVPTALLEDRGGALWIGTFSEGLFQWQAGQLQRAPTSQQEITCLFEDREGNILAGTAGGGLNLIRPRSLELIGKESGLPFESVQSVSEGAEGGLWMVSRDGQLVHGLGGSWDLVSSGANWPGGKATCVATDPTGGVWVGTSDRGLKHFQNGRWRGWSQRNGLASDGVRSLLVASNGDVWVGTLYLNRLQRVRDGEVQVITNTTHLGAIRALAESADGTIWIGTAEGEILKVHDLTLINEPAINEPIPLSVRSLLATPDGSLWIGYAGEGLGWLKDGRYKRLTTEAGLADDFISQLLADGGGNLWIAGNRGLSRVSFAELDSVIAGRAQRLSARSYGSADGLPGLQPNRDYWPSAARSSDGRLWFSMRNGLLAAQPGNISENALPPMVHLERVSVDDQLVALYNAGSPFQFQVSSNLINLRGDGAKLLLGPGHRKLEIQFAALSFTSPENVQFRYQLSGFDTDWVEAETHHSATYPRLPAGDYEFRVIACNNTGVWNEKGAVLAFTVSPFFYETWWFKMGGGLFTVLAAGGCALAISRTRYRRKLRRLEARRALEQERARIAKDIHDDLGASLTRISLLSQPSRSDPEDQEAAIESLAQIHQTARDLTHAMGEVVWAVNPEHDTFDSLANYVSNYSQNFLRVAGIRCRLEMPVQLPRQELSSGIRHNLLLAFKEALSNVAKHAHASEVQIALTADESGFELLVADNGKGFSLNGEQTGASRPQTDRASPGNGLINMRSRLKEIGGECSMKSEPGVGTKVTFHVDLKKQHARQ